MKSRTRSRTRYALSGARYGSNAAHNQWVYLDGPFSYKEMDWSMVDYIDKRKDPITGLTPPSPLTLRKTDIKPVFLNYRLTSNIDGKLYNKYVDVPCAAPAALTPPSPSIGWEALEGSTAALTAQLLADSNPFRYTISVPVMIAELIEAPTLLKLALNNMFSLTGSAYLNWNFGWKLLMADIRTLAKITKSIESRIREFNQIVEKGGLRRRVKLTSSGYQNAKYTTPIYSSGLGVWYGDVTPSFKTKVWGSVRWVPNRASPIDLHGLANFNEACKIVLDLKAPDFSTIWEAIPFSWLVDYFLNVGNVLQAVENSDKVLPTDICIMRRRTIDVPCSLSTVPPSTSTWKKESKGTAGIVRHEVLLRETVNPNELGDLLSFGFMTKGQATNLLALLFSLRRFKK